MSPAISVVTPTYQRAGTLPRLYESLAGQGFADFEWVIVDDGSTDGTADLVRAWEAEASFPIRYSRQENQGKHAAFNRCVERASGRFCALIDSDDWYMPGALAGMLECWESIPAGRRESFANVEGLRVDAGGAPVGGRFPTDVFDSNTFELGVVHGVRGDTIGMYRRDVLSAFPFPEDLGWHVTPDLVWNRIAARYSTRFANRVWAYTDYQSEGLSARVEELRLRFPRTGLIYWTEFAAMPRPMPLRERIRAHANRARYWLLAGRPPGELLGEGARGGWALACFPLGAGLCLRDRWRGRSIAGESG
jgi:glycosyltransferase involved in cell wall biosynthesis